MSERSNCRLSDIAVYVTGKLNSNAAVSNGNYPFFTCSPETLRIDNYAFDTEALILAGNNADGVFSLKYYNGKFNAYQRTYIITVVDRMKTDYKFLFYSLKTQLLNLEIISHGTATKYLTLPILNYIPILLPPLPEQRAIAGVLSSLDDKIDLLHRQNKTLEGMAEALWQKMFVEEANPNWNKGKLGDEMNITMGQSPPGNTYNEENRGMLFFQGRAEFGFRFPQARLYCTKPKRLAKRCDTLVSVRAPVGDINMASDECCIGRGLAALRHNKGFVSYTFYKVRSLKDDFDSFEQQGTVFGSIGKDDFNGIDTFLPDLKIIQQFDALAKPLDDKIFTNSIQISTLSHLRDRLLPKLISGEVRVKV
jgi:type I restriction enzyme S subunit